MRAVISAVAEQGYQATTVADIVDRARVSRSVMYREFGTKLDCFLAAIEAGRDIVLGRLAEAIDAVGDGTLESVARAVAHAHLDNCASEPDHTRAWVQELAASGPRGIAMRSDYLDQVAAVMRSIDCRFGSGHPRSQEHYVALVGGITELVSRQISDGGTGQLRDLEGPATAAIVAMLR